MLELLDKQGKQDVIQRAIDIIEDLDEVYTSDIHHYCYNELYFIVGTYAAEEWLKSHIGVFTAIDAILDYQKENFGNVFIEITPEAICNMVAYIAGEDVLYSLSSLQELQCTYCVLTDALKAKILQELEELKGE